MRGKIEAEINTEKDEIIILAKSNKNVENYIIDKHIIKEVYIPNRLVNFVVK